jgi:Lon protease-like protein
MGMGMDYEDTFFTEVEQDKSSKIPVIYTGSVLLPTDRSQFLIHEPYYLEMFRSIGVGGVFGHCLHSNAAPEAMSDGAITIGDMEVGLKGPGIEVGCLARVVSIHEQAGGNSKELVVKYECTRRFFVTEHDETALFSSTMVEWLDDTDTVNNERDADYLKYLDSLERNLWEALLEIAKLEKKLGHSKNSLPEAVREFAPPEMETKQYSRASIDEGIWKGTAKPKKPPTLNSNRLSSYFGNKEISPYQVIGENEHECRSKRQELFAFAAASLVAETGQEQLALLTSRSTGAKLEWVIAAAKPYLEMLRAENQLYRSVK